MKRTFARLSAVACLLAAAPLAAQGVIQQVGPVTSGHLAIWWQNGQVYDGGPVPPSVFNYSANETPVGLINGTNTVYTILQVPVNGSIQLYYNGILLEPGIGNDYVLNGSTITMAYALPTGTKLRAYYFY